MTESTPQRVQLSIKFGNNGSGYAIVEAATTEALVEEAGKLMDQAGFLNAVVEEVQARGTIVQAYPETTQVAPAPSPWGSQNPGTPAGPPVENCAHGVPRKYQEGISKAGRPYKGFFCQVKGDPRLPQCPPKFLN